MDKQKKLWFPGWDAIAPYLMVVYVLMLAVVGFFVSRVTEWNGITVAIMAAAALSYSFLYMVPGLLLTALVSVATVKAGEAAWRRRLVTGCAVGTMFLSHLLLLMDAGLYHGFGFHFNFLVWNLLTTPGGFASMGLRAGTILTLVGGIVLLLLVHAGIMAAFVWLPKLRVIAVVLKSWRKYALAGLCLVCLLFSMFAYGYEHYMLRSTPLVATATIPLFQGATMSRFLSGLGVRPPNREVMQVKANAGKYKNLNYPAHPIERSADRPKYNVVWLACESWRADMLTPEIMPNASKFAEKAVNFKNNYSGGNGTRQGIFTMFYSIYGNYWDSFLKSRRGPVFIDWLIEDNYNFKCITSAKFSYPEFDQTVFCRVPSESLHSDDHGPTYTRDQRNVKLLTEFIRNADRSRPFMAFMFFESPHAPYEFPEEAVIRKEYAQELNYAKVSSGDGTMIKNRYINSNHHLDMRLAEVFKALDDGNLWENTIVVLVGDHGEEFYEKGRLGHNSTFVQEQVRTPLVIHIPGVKPQVYTGMSSHLDVVPILAPYFGVTNPIADYSLGYNLLDPAQKRTYTIIANWSQVFYASPKYKTLLPSNSIAFATQKLTDGNDNPLPSLDPFYNENKAELFQIQRDLTRFVK